MELLEKLDRMLLLAYPAGKADWEDEPRVEIAPGIEIYYDQLAIYEYLIRSAGYTADLITVDELESLYNSYDEELEKKILNVYAWIRHGGDASERIYRRSVRAAFDLYKEKYGAFNDIESFSDMRTKDLIAMEQYVRDNPSFMPRAEYYLDLDGMRIRDPSAY